MRAVVLVGGFGTRLRPLTSTTPKPMLPVGHRPILEHLLTNLARAGVTEATLALGFKPEPFIEAFPTGECAGVTLRYAVEPEPLDTAGAIRFAAEFSGIDDTFIVANGDIFTDLDMSLLVDHHRQHGAIATIHLIPVPDPSSFGVVDTDENTRVKAFIEKPAPGTEPTNLINAGTYVLEASALGYIASGRKVSIEREVFPAIVADGGVYAMAREVYWLDTGRPELYLQANFDLLDGRRPDIEFDAVHATATVATSATIERSMIGEGAVVGAGAIVRNSVLLAGAVVGAGATLEGCAVMGAVGAKAHIVGTVVGIDGVVAGGEELSGARRPSEP
jgi:mannose-1-phosphate guanylyltransferase